ncbi:hypothetical protein GALMADRAFT_80808 [Galerina marginata CBS 339.88]|uniref:DUF3533 domain-containing protein n=1 Tax=Galerina marginata (strain CBS 339.88) TaxID=685588 RepID=A0A067SIC6_GALM3|nr:hypothetical protein GALMADRAFT_80808 [Galerina marginata CBS 339.88]
MAQTHGFSDKSRPAAAARAVYLKIFLGGSFAMVLTIFSVFSIFWGALWKIPSHTLPGWVVDFDGGLIGQNVAQALTSQSGPSKVTWTVIPASQFPGGPSEVGAAVLEEHTWTAITINEGSTARLSNSLITPNASYDGTQAITVFAVEARNENAFRSLIRPSVQASLGAISGAIAIQTAQKVANSTNLASILTTSPQTVTAPISYQIQNLAPFDIPVATAVTFVGLIYQLILSFFIVMITHSAREASGLDKTLHTRSLITLRFVSSFGAYFVISLFYSLLSMAFQLTLTRKFGHGGFVIFWMLNYASMLSVGLALESLMTLLTTKGIPFFMITWIIINVSVCVFPMEVMPKFFHYGYAVPFYNVSRAMRTIVFGTKNRVGLSFGILIAWVAISCISLPLIQMYVRKKANNAARIAAETAERETEEKPTA